MKKVVSGIMLTLLLTSILMLAFNIRQAESSEPPTTEWTRTYGGTGYDEARSVVQTSDEGYAIAGWTSSFGVGSHDFWLVKTDANGNTQWNKTYGGVRSDRAHSVIETDDGGYALSGDTWSFSGWADFWLVKTDSAGNMEWNQTYSGLRRDEAYSKIIQTDDGGYVVAGYTDVPGAGQDFWLVKTDSAGNMMWNATFGGESDEVAHDLVQTSDGGYVLAGNTASFGAQGSDMYVVKVDSFGNMEWAQTWGGPNDDFARFIIQTSDGGYAIVGFTESFGAGLRDIWLVKTDSGGNMQWNRTYGGPNHDNGDSVVQTNDGGYAIAGTKNYFTGNPDFWLVKVDSSGNMQWNQTYGGPNSDLAYSMVKTSDGGYALAGHTDSFGAGDYDFWLIKLTPEEIPATVDIDPDTLNLKSKGEWITGYIELPEGYDVNDINVTTVMLNDTVAAELYPTEVGDYDSDGIPDLMVKFDRADVISYMLANVNMTKLFEKRFMTVTLTITGKLNDDTPFQGSDTIRIALPVHGKQGIFLV